MKVYMAQLLPHQIEAVEKTPNKWGLWFKMRVGKTPTAIRLASTRVRSCIVIVPKSIKQQWENEVVKWNDSNCEFFIITKETFRRDALKIKRYDAIIIDEAHRQASNYKNLFFKSLQKYINIHNPSHRWLLTGTPYTANAWGPYSYKIILGQEPNWFLWNNKYFIQIKMGKYKVPVFRRGMEEELRRELLSIGTVIDLKDIADVAEDNIEIETFDLNAEQKSNIKNITDFLPIVKYTKYHQLESGVLKSDGYVDSINILCEKDKRLLELVEDEDKIIIVCRYLDQIEKYKKLLNDCGKKIFVISGQTKESASVVAEYAEKEDKAIVLVQGDTCDGYSLESFNTMVFASQSYSFVNYDQMKSRMKSRNKLTACNYIHLITSGESVDRAVYNCVKHKEDFSAELFKKKYEETI